jgi:hypothetical protein
MTPQTITPILGAAKSKIMYPTLLQLHCHQQMPVQCFDLHTSQCWQLLPSPRDREREIQAHTHALKHIYTQTQGSSSHNSQLLTAYQMTDADWAAGPSRQDSYSLLHCLLQVPSVSQTCCWYNQRRYCNTAAATKADVLQQYISQHYNQSSDTQSSQSVMLTSVRSLLYVKYDCELIPLFSQRQNADTSWSGTWDDHWMHSTRCTLNFQLCELKQCSGLFEQPPKQLPNVDVF